MKQRLKNVSSAAPSGAGTFVMTWRPRAITVTGFRSVEERDKHPGDSPQRLHGKAYRASEFMKLAKGHYGPFGALGYTTEKGVTVCLEEAVKHLGGQLLFSGLNSYLLDEQGRVIG